MGEDLLLDIQFVEFAIDRRDIDCLAVAGPGLPVPEATCSRVRSPGHRTRFEVKYPNVVDLTPMRRVLGPSICVNLACFASDDLAAQWVTPGSKEYQARCCELCSACNRTE